MSRAICAVRVRDAPGRTSCKRQASGSNPLTGSSPVQSAHRRLEFVVPDTVTSYSPARTDVPAVVDVSAVARAAS